MRSAVVTNSMRTGFPLKGCRSSGVGYWLAKGMVQVTQAWSPCVAVV